VIDRPNQVWAADITYVPIARSSLYLVAIMDWASRAVLSWRLSNTMDSSFCVEALEEALPRFSKPEIFQHRPGQPVHQHPLYWRAGARRREHLDGWTRAVDRQRLH
jgi:putative transposase